MYKLILFITLVLLLIFQVDADSHRHPKYNSCCKPQRVYHYQTPTQECRTRICRTHNNIVKEINGGSARYVVNGTYKVCTDPQKRSAVTENYEWNWTRSRPYYRKMPIYLEERPTRSRYGHTEDEYVHSRQHAQRSYYYW